ncbi:hypothetical protein GCM10012284_30460 [Mangrovihabitans endophyticus]|uniref:Uncharacterized protein n=1 Tax=Mangrovihabitans endophyticus TaxID=1751298 RepID=A0A8J3BZ09_9ACTN|nr:hypothetical protein GCM10012284_30460 [Mangrovihabitans endophyticus]
MVGVLAEGFAGCFGKAVDAGALGVECRKQRESLDAHRLLDCGRLTQLRPAQRIMQLVGQVLDPAFPTTAP